MFSLLALTEKVQDEIDSVIGQSRQPTMADRANMPYTDAVIHEIQRMGNIVPLGFPKMTCKDTMLGEHFIPKVSERKYYKHEDIFPAIYEHISHHLGEYILEAPSTFSPLHL